MDEKRATISFEKVELSVFLETEEKPKTKAELCIEQFLASDVEMARVDIDGTLVTGNDMIGFTQKLRRTIQDLGADLFVTFQKNEIYLMRPTRKVLQMAQRIKGPAKRSFLLWALQDRTKTEG